jgi:hypothetical protein
MRSPILLLALSACAAAGQSSISRERAALDTELAGRVAGPPEKCIPTETNTGLQIVDEHTLVHRRGAVIWVNRLPDTCRGLRPFETLLVEVHGGSYCRGDLVRSLPAQGGVPGPACFLGDFTPYRRP